MSSTRQTWATNITMQKPDQVGWTSSQHFLSQFDSQLIFYFPLENLICHFDECFQFVNLSIPLPFPIPILFPIPARGLIPLLLAHLPVPTPIPPPNLMCVYNPHTFLILKPLHSDTQYFTRL